MRLVEQSNDLHVIGSLVHAILNINIKTPRLIIALIGQAQAMKARKIAPQKLRAMTTLAPEKSENTPPCLIIDMNNFEED